MECLHARLHLTEVPMDTQHKLAVAIATCKRRDETVLKSNKVCGIAHKAWTRDEKLEARVEIIQAIKKYRGTQEIAQRREISTILNLSLDQRAFPFLDGAYLDLRQYSLFDAQLLTTHAELILEKGILAKIEIGPIKKRER